MKLKPCPFCGGDVLGREQRGEIYVVCFKCEAKGPAANSGEEAERLWNTRAFQLKEIEWADERT